MAALDPTILTALGGILALIGLLLAFVGRKMWTPFMSLVGAIIGGALGYIVGAVFFGNNVLAAGLLGLIGSVLGSILFNYLVKIALALIAAAIPAGLAYYGLGGSGTAQDTAVIAAILVLLVFFAIAYYFVEELIGVVTSLVGGALLGVGVFLVTGNGTWAIVGGAVVFLVGAIVQTLAIRRAKKGGVWRMRRAKAAQAAMYAPPPSPPPAAPPVQRAPPTSPPSSGPMPPPPPPPPP